MAVQQESVTIVQIISLPVSFLSLARASVVADEVFHYDDRRNNELNMKNELVHFAKHILVLSSRLFAAALVTVMARRLFQNYFCQLYHFIASFVMFFIYGIHRYCGINKFSVSCTHHSVGCSCTGYKLSVINLHSVGCTHSSVAVSCNYLQCRLYTLLSRYSVDCTHYSITCKIYSVSCSQNSVGCTHYSVGCKYLLCRLQIFTLSVVNIYSDGCTPYSDGCVHNCLSVMYITLSVVRTTLLVVTLSVINIYVVGCRDLLSRLYALLCQLRTLLCRLCTLLMLGCKHYSVGCVHYPVSCTHDSVGCVRYSVSCTYYSVGCKDLLCWL